MRPITIEGPLRGSRMHTSGVVVLGLLLLAIGAMLGGALAALWFEMHPAPPVASQARVERVWTVNVKGDSDAKVLTCREAR